MFLKKSFYMLNKVWLPYLLAIIATATINFSFKHFIDKPHEVVWGILIVAAAAFVFLLGKSIYASVNINRVRVPGGLQKTSSSHVELDPSIVSLDMAFLIFASWKIGESIIKIPKLIGEQITPDQLVFIFTTLALTAYAILYSFIKVLDKIKEYKGVSQSNPMAASNMQGLSFWGRFLNIALDFFISMAFLVIIPGIMGLIFYTSFIQDILK